MIIKGFNGIFRTDNEGLPPTLGRNDNPEPQLNNTPPQRQAKCAIELRTAAKQHTPAAAGKMRH